ncbi:TPA: fimbria/pilus periplasmic chaperone [Enterobacter asburiae]|uniref:fimbria/pilus periplasmic chaperone n=1 Tax=Enterobacter asburiae TaxID=61645 RepID=UPI0010BA39FC|nr:fimbria/pilus periplasmic chaperone [Enterobacter asburiae]BEK81565.1 fimbria/pilus periplasmic chaperone [Enterobacter asburiae]HEC5301801.1 fimbria/pilus periplasmic chaperone [Enterobacter asburiae]
MANFFSLKIISAMAAISFTISSYAEDVSTNEGKINTSTQSFALQLNQSRVIYSTDSKGATLTISNPQDYPILVQSKVLEDDRATPASFVITPPLFRLDGNQQSRIKILQTGGKQANDREMLKWLCVTGIPPKMNDAWADDSIRDKLRTKDTNINLKISVSNCIKLFVRPGKLGGQSVDAASQIEWSHSSSGLKAENKSPFYMALSYISVNGKKINKIDYIEPFSFRIFKSDVVSGEVEWKVINDFGGESDTFKAKLK